LPGISKVKETCIKDRVQGDLIDGMRSKGMGWYIGRTKKWTPQDFGKPKAIELNQHQFFCQNFAKNG